VPWQHRLLQDSSCTFQTVFKHYGTICAAKFLNSVAML
jgi:hypothetical protein